MKIYYFYFDRLIGHISTENIHFRSLSHSTVLESILFQTAALTYTFNPNQK